MSNELKIVPLSWGNKTMKIVKRYEISIRSNIIAHRYIDNLQNKYGKELEYASFVKKSNEIIHFALKEHASEPDECEYYLHNSVKTGFAVTEIAKPKLLGYLPYP